jgi:hypothetical protein
MKMAAEGPSSFDANPKRLGLQPQCEGSHSRNAGRFFVEYLRQWWLDEFDRFYENMIAEIFSIKTMSFWKNLNEGKTERGPEKGEHLF